MVDSTLDMSGITECSLCSHEPQRVDVEGVFLFVYHCYHRRWRDTVSYTQSCHPMTFGERTDGDDIASCTDRSADVWQIDSCRKLVIDIIIDNQDIFWNDVQQLIKHVLPKRDTSRIVGIGEINDGGVVTDRCGYRIGTDTKRRWITSCIDDSRTRLLSSRLVDKKCWLGDHDT